MADYHVIDIDPLGTWKITHPPACPLDERQCGVHRSAEQIVGPDTKPGRFECRLGPLDQLLIGREIPVIDTTDPTDDGEPSTQDRDPDVLDFNVQRAVSKHALDLAARLLGLLLRQGRFAGDELRSVPVSTRQLADWRDLLEQLLQDHYRLDPERDQAAADAIFHGHGEGRGIRGHHAVGEPLCDLCASFLAELQSAGLVREVGQ